MGDCSMPGSRTTLAVRLPKALYWSTAPLASLIVAAGCVAAPAAGAPSSSPAVLASPVASPSAVASALATPAAVGTVSPSGAAATPVLPPATVDISPAQVQVGTVTLSMSIEPA